MSLFPKMCACAYCGATADNLHDAAEHQMACHKNPQNMDHHEFWLHYFGVTEFEHIFLQDKFKQLMRHDGEATHLMVNGPHLMVKVEDMVYKFHRDNPEMALSSGVVYKSR